MTFENDANATSTPAILTPEVQQAVWFLGALVRVRTGGDSFVIITASGQLNGMIGAATPYGSRCNRGQGACGAGLPLTTDREHRGG